MRKALASGLICLLLIGWIAEADVVRSVAPPSGGSGGGGASTSADNTWSGTQTFRDNKFAVTDDSDTSKILNLQLSSISASTTRTLTVPDVNGTLVTLEGASQTVSGSTFQIQSLVGVILSNSYLHVGNSANTHNGFIWDPTQTPDTGVLATGTTGNTWIIGEKQDYGFDYAVAQQANPTLVLASASQNTNERIGIRHNATQGEITDLAATAANQRPIRLHGGPAVASAATITPTGNFFHVTGTTGITAVTVLGSGTQFCMVFDGVLTLTDNNGTFNLAGDFTTTANDVLCLASDGTNYYETSRSVN